jgi:hypothetical protein
MTYDFQKPFSAKVVTYEAYVEAKLEAPKHLAPIAHDLHFEPRYDEFRGRTIWSLSWKPACRVGSDQCSGEPATALDKLTQCPQNCIEALFQMVPSSPKA